MRAPLCPATWATHCVHAKAVSRVLALAPHALARTSVRALRARALKATVIHTVFQNSSLTQLHAWRLRQWRLRLVADTSYLLVSAGKETVRKWRAIGAHIGCTL